MGCAIPSHGEGKGGVRKDMTFGEVLLWNQLKDDQFWGFDFDRQRCIDNYIVDFYCKQLMLAIEIDGMSHNYEEAFLKDETRQDRLESLGVRFIRFTESEVKYDMVNVSVRWRPKLLKLLKVIAQLGYQKASILACWNK